MSDDQPGPGGRLDPSAEPESSTPPTARPDASRPVQHGEPAPASPGRLWARHDADDTGRSWHSFGVPHGGAPEPPAYTPAFRERTRREAGPEPVPEPDPAGSWEQPAGAGIGPGFTRPGPSQPQSSADGTPLGPDLTQPIDTSSTREVEQAPVVPAPVAAPGPSGYWWNTPAGPTHTEGPSAGPAPLGYQPPTGQPYATGWPTPGPLTPPPAEQPVGAAAREPRRRRGIPWAGALLVAILAAVLGGAVALAGQQLIRGGSTLGSAVPAPGPGSTSRPDGSIAKIAADALPSVVTIRITSSQGNGTGSGFVLDTQGHVLTNNHVATAGGTTATIAVELNNGKTLPATIVGADASYDLAVLKIDATDIPPLQFGSSKDVVVGDGVIAVGAPLGLDATVTSGIVSALNRPVTPGDGNDQSFINAVQTDAAINPGNSGGPLLNMNGQVIGVNSAIARVPGSTSSSGGNIGVGFAIPSDQAAKTAQQLITTGKADHPALGVKVDRSYTGDGAKIASGGVTDGSAAATAGLQEGDVIVSIDGKNVTDADALIVAVRSRNVGDTVALKVQRDGQTVDVNLTLQSATN